jgi:uncharacterized protein (DUF305 family)
MKKWLAIALAGTLPAVFAACGDDDDSISEPTVNQSADSSAPTVNDFNAADVSFAQGMIPHHQEAVEMAEIAVDPAVGAGVDVVALASRIKSAQDPEIEMMTGWLEAWGEPMEMDMGEDNDMGSMDAGMSEAEMDGLRAETGAEFDRRWMETMIAHHEGAIAMAESVKSDGTNAEVVALADAIIAAQQAEIDEMQALLAG